MSKTLSASKYGKYDMPKRSNYFGPLSRDSVSSINLSPRMESTGIRVSPLKLKLDMTQKMLMLNISGVNV